MNITQQQKKALIVIAAVFFGSYIVRYCIIAAYSAQAYARRAVIQAQKHEGPKRTVPPKAQALAVTAAPVVSPPPVVVQASPVTAQVEPPKPEATPVQTKAQAVQQPTPPPAKPLAMADPKLIGVFRGPSAIDGRGACDVRFEVKPSESETSNLVTGFASMVCRPNAALARNNPVSAKKQALNSTNYETAILTGTPQDDGSIRFALAKGINTDSSGCQISLATLTAFGSTFVAAEWQENEPCNGGKSVMQRAGR